MLAEKSATSENIASILEKWLRMKATKGGDVFLYFSGYAHVGRNGTPDSLVLSDASSSDLTAGGYSMERLSEDMKALGAKQITLAFDLCLFPSPGWNTPPPPTNCKYSKPFPTPSRRIRLSAFFLHPRRMQTSKRRSATACFPVSFFRGSTNRKEPSN